MTELDHITSFSDLISEIKEIEDYLLIEMSGEPIEALERGNTLVVYIARSGKMMCDAKYHQDQDKTDIIESITQDSRLLHLPATALNAYVNSKAKNTNRLYARCERLHRNCEKSWEWCRSVLSYAKEEMKMGGSIK